MINIPSNDELAALIGIAAYKAWMAVSEMIKSKYEMEELWNNGGKNWDYEYKFRRGGKTLCGLYAKKDCAGLMIIFGGEERLKFEAVRELLSTNVQKQYDDAKTFHDGKWVMFQLDSETNIPDFEKLLLIKRKPNKK